jgi:tRNA (guanine-N7-)-methyltransferase
MARAKRAARSGSLGERSRRLIFAPEPQVDWREVFGNDRPVEVEIGFGKGAFLLEVARARPETNFFGIENQRRWVRRVEERIVRRGLSNVRVVWADAALLIGRFVRDASVRAYHVYFPDPWWKKRHHKRRLVTPEFARALHRTLEPGGTVWIATDVPERFQAMLAAFAGLPMVVEVGATVSDRPPTNFERKYRAEGRSLFYAAVRKPESGPAKVHPPASGGKTFSS